MVFETLKKHTKNKVLPILLAAGMALTPFNSNPVSAQIENPTTQTVQYWYRSPGREKHSGGTYSNVYDSTKMYRDEKNIPRYNEEGAIGKDLDIHNNNTEAIFTVSDYASNYQCDKFGAEIIYNDGVSPPLERPDLGVINGNKAILEISKDLPFEHQFAALYCIHDDDKDTPIPNDSFREILASYRLRNYYNQNNRVLSTLSTNKNPVIPPIVNENGSKTGKTVPVSTEPNPKTSTEKPVNPAESKLPSESYELGNDNTNKKYYLKTDCGTPEKVISNVKRELPSYKWGMVELKDGPRTCVIISDIEGDLFKDYNISLPKQAPITYSGDKLEVKFSKPGFYQVEANTQSHPDKNVLVFKVDYREIKTDENGEGKIDFASLIPGKDEFNAQLNVKPFLRKRVNATETPVYKNQKSLNQILEDIGDSDFPVVKIHPGNSLELLVNSDDNIVYSPSLYKIIGIGGKGIRYEKVNLKQSKLNHRKVKINSKGKLEAVDNNLQNKLIVFPYDQERIGAYSGLSNLYLLTLTGYDKNDNSVKDLDTLVIEVNANLDKVYFEGFLAGLGVGGGIGYGAGLLDAANPGGLFTVIKNSPKTVPVIPGTKTGGNL